MTDDVHMVGPAHPLPPMRVAAEPEERERITVDLVGGPFHGERYTCWKATRTIERAWTPDTTPPETPPEDAADVEHRPAPAEPFALTAWYVRDGQDALTATFDRFEV